MMAKKARATFQKREKERARQQKQHDKAQRRVAAKAQRGSSAPPMADDAFAIAGMRPGPQAVPAPWEEAPPAEAVAVATNAERTAHEYVCCVVPRLVRRRHPSLLASCPRWTISISRRYDL